MKRAINILLASLVNCLVWGNEELPVRLNASDLILSRGRRLMSLKHVSNGGSGKVASWVIPDGFQINNYDYLVRFDDSKRDFSVNLVSAGKTTLVASGKVVRMDNEQLARSCGFGVMAMTNMPLKDYASNIHVSNPPGMTNLIQITYRNSTALDRDVFIFKNLYVSLGGVSNKLDFAVSLLNSGLPESERLPPIVQHR